MKMYYTIYRMDFRFIWNGMSNRLVLYLQNHSACSVRRWVFSKLETLHVIFHKFLFEVYRIAKSNEELYFKYVYNY